ncbi:type IV pilus modification protein PilV [Collimonas pratensis]|uniref:Type IV pilus modification protein PilV n=1 Tax=Collimonas pratensis TaxID=279113 RepID=A0A127QAS1_9BURK|nr:type IV pilus modification protein PilV [Collimonas pratensis]AMP06722.1 type IV pilus modification protein PilV [Collimonas pratensis]
MKISLKQQSGFFLLEVLIAVLIFSFGILGLVGLQATTINNSVSAEDRSQAALLADNLVGMMWAKSKLVGGSCDLLCATDAGSAKDYTNWKTQVAASLQSGVGKATLDATNPSLVTISITWTAASKSNNTKTASHNYTTEVVVQ